MFRRQLQRRDLLSALAPYITDDLWPTAVDTAMACLHQAYQADALIVFAGYMSDTARPLAVAAADRITGLEASAKVSWGLNYVAAGRDARDDRGVEPTHTGEASVTTPPADLIELFGPVLGTPSGQRTPSAAAKHQHRRPVARLRVMPSELDRVATIRSVAPDLEDDEAVEILEIVDELREPANRQAALQVMACHASPAVVPRIWDSLRRIPETQLYASVLLSLGPRLSMLAAPQAHAIWADIVRSLAAGRRSILLDGIRTLVPVITALGHQRELVDTAVSINEVGTWWP